MQVYLPIPWLQAFVYFSVIFGLFPGHFEDPFGYRLEGMGYRPYDVLSLEPTVNQIKKQIIEDPFVVADFVRK